MTGTTGERFEELRQVRRLRHLVVLLAIGCATPLTLGATSKPDELTLRRLAWN
jgi:hypothetical protein